MTIRPTASVSFRHESQETERQFRNLDERVKELTNRPSWLGEVIRDIELESGVLTLVPHPVGRPVSVFLSPPRGGTTTGEIVETRASSIDHTRYIELTAKGFGATITVDLWVL